MLVAVAVTVAGDVVGVAVVVGAASVAAATAAASVAATAAATAAAIAVAAMVTVFTSVAVLHHNFMTHGALSGRQLRMEASADRLPGQFALFRRVCSVALRAVERPLVRPNRTSTLREAV